MNRRISNIYLLFTIINFIALGFGANLKAQNNDNIIDVSQFSSYKLLWDNDVMMQTDYYYTQGLGMEIILPALEKNPLNFMFFKPKGFQSVYGLSIHQETYTPTIIKVQEVLIGDRPYAGALYAKSFIRSSNYEKKLFINNEFDFGFIGPNSLAGITQYKFHVLSDNHLPLGWANEIKQVPVFNYNLTVNKGLITDEFHEVQALSRIRVGTMYDDLSLGLTYRVGLMNSTYQSAGENIYLFKKFQAYFTFGPQVKFVGYNATMQGSPFVTDSDQYVILPHQVERIVYSVKSGVTLMYKNVGTSFHLNWQSPEFNGGLNHTYHSFIFFYNF